MENKHLTRTIFSLIVMLISISIGCTKVIHLDLNTANPLLVIQGNVNNHPGPYIVLLSETSSYFDTVSPPKVTGAIITITDNSGPADTLLEVSPGQYQTQHTQGVQGHTYVLTVLTGGQKYQAASTMPDTVSIAYLTYVLKSAGRLGGTQSTNQYRVHCHFKDPPGIKNYYRAQLTYNDTTRNGPDDLTSYSDALSDGDSIDLTLRSEYVLSGDSVRVDLFSIDVNVYNYYKVLQSVVDQSGVNSTATPQNPPTNLSNGAIGYFSASSITSMNQVAP